MAKTPKDDAFKAGIIEKDKQKELADAGFPTAEEIANQQATGQDIQTREREKHRRMWAEDRIPTALSSVVHLSKFLTHCAPVVNETVIDFGCGAGFAGLYLRERGLKVAMVDIADNCLDPMVEESLLPGWLDFHEACLWDLPESLEPASWFVCCNVLEHLPERFVEQALENIQAKSTRGGFFVISASPEKSAQWWLDRLAKYWRIMPLEITDSGLKIAVAPSVS
jgi:2-polyprenyl-3-methyl-5-hydroxy-6-metoxy-1,4-benzoquinol methylase